MTTTAPTKDERDTTEVDAILFFWLLVMTFMTMVLITWTKILITSASTNDIISQSMMEWNGWMLSFINERTIGIAAFIIIGTMNFLQQRNNHAALSADIRQLSNAIAENNDAALRHREQQPHPAATE